MAQHGQSSRIVVDLDPSLKRELYDALQASGRTLKEWVVHNASAFCADVRQPPLFPEMQNGLNGKAAGKTRRRSKSKTKTKKFSVVSMFSGCGGMDLGFVGDFEFLGCHYPALPYDVIWANDLNAAACKTYSQNLGHEIHHGDIWEHVDSMPEEADVIVGGFPCQDISVNGKMKGVDGARSGLYTAMVHAVDRIRPKVFVAENVKGLLLECNRESLRRVLSDFGALGYAVTYHLYNAADFGVPQTRERVIFVGTPCDAKPFQPPDAERDSASWITSEQALSDLEGTARKVEISHIWSEAKRSPEQGDRRLKAERPGYTIRAECHGNIQWHYRLPRRISMREAARIQSFPDDFLFSSGIRETERQVGNAVPPVLAWHVANAVLDCLA